MEESKTKKFTNWVQDSLQAIIVIIITLLILAFVIYSYAKKSTNKDAVVNDSSTNGEVVTETLADENENLSSDVVISGGDTTETNTKNNSVENTNNSEQSNLQNDDVNSSEDGQYTVYQNDNQNVDNNSKSSENSVYGNENDVNQSQQTNNTEGEITMTASYGDSLTVLARRATAQYISENDVQNITPAHKIYIEDYLQKRVTNRVVENGTTVSFSKAQINEAIQSANSLNDQQLRHLDGYVKYVSSGL